MIKKYVLRNRTINIVDNFNRSHFFEIPAEYAGCLAVYQFETFLIVIFATNDNTRSPVKMRRNVWRINEKGEVAWMVEDPLIAHKRHLGDQADLTALKCHGFVLMHRKEEKWLLDNFFVDLETGKLTFWKAERF